MCPTHKSPLAHPLSSLRRKEGLSHAAYAQLVARKHAELGFGTMAARREKIARWESGKVTPELTAQFTIARLYGVPRAEVLRLGWPHWLPVAGGPSVPLCAPWTAEEALRSLRSLSRSLQAPAPDGAHFTVCAGSVDQLLTHWQESTRTPPPPPEREGRPPADATVTALETRHHQLRQLCRTETPSTSRVLADAELRMVTELLHTACYGPELGSRLLTAAAHAACLSGLLAYELGDQAHAQAAYVAALRAGVLARAHEPGLWALVLLAAQQATQGAPANALRLLAPADQPPHVPARDRSPLPAVVQVTRQAARTLLERADPTSSDDEFTAADLDILIRHTFAYEAVPAAVIASQAHRGHTPPSGISSHERLV
ncbi:hypothetical protein [Streptomyces sp. ERV7]|uniref:hypothetical protein n=1 Tax=Streptomyces sp. ERV7 TaxID=1322334 RepID=UPI00131BE040|nr:hypothetical protein [Streptomyces sp. ERV7]